MCCDWPQAGKASMGISEHERAAEALQELTAVYMWKPVPLS